LTLGVGGWKKICFREQEFFGSFFQEIMPRFLKMHICARDKAAIDVIAGGFKQARDVELLHSPGKRQVIRYLIPDPGV
jgi:hypothetical protein